MKSTYGTCVAPSTLPQFGDKVWFYLIIMQYISSIPNAINSKRARILVKLSPQKSRTIGSSQKAKICFANNNEFSLQLLRVALQDESDCWQRGGIIKRAGRVSNRPDIWINQQNHAFDSQQMIFCIPLLKYHTAQVPAFMRYGHTKASSWIHSAVIRWLNEERGVE